MAEIKPVGGLRLTFVSLLGDAVDYQNGRPASQRVFDSSAELGLGRHLNLTLMHTFQRLAFQGDRIFTANLAQVRIIYNFSVRVFVRAVVQLFDLDRVPAMYAAAVSPRTNTVFTQLLFSYKLNPQTVLFLGYSDNAFGSTGLDITRTDRTFFLKVGYAWLR
jgi:hypothetical protein